MPPRNALSGSMSQDAKICGHVIVRGNANRHAIRYARDRVNGDGGPKFDYNYCLDRFRKLYNHYTVFQYIIEQAGVEHNPTTHDVRASEETWNSICRVHELAYAYMRKGEADYDALRFIFNAVPCDPVNGNKMVEVIQISSDESGGVAGGDNDGAAFDPELAWYVSEDSGEPSDLFTNTKRNGKAHVKSKTRGEVNRRSNGPRYAQGSGPSSQASSSPFKPFSSFYVVICCNKFDLFSLVY